MSNTLRIWRNNRFTSWRPSLWDVLAMLIVLFAFFLLAWAASQMGSPYQLGKPINISLAPHHLPKYALFSVLRMLIAALFSLLFTFTIGTFAAKNRHIERFVIPLIDIMQSVPVLGFLSITVVGFIALFPNSLWGPECAAIFAIFTSQVWNITLGFYQSLKTLPHELYEASDVFQLSIWQRFWRVEVPFAMPSLVWNMMMSMSASWFMVVACEAISVNNQSIMLPGIGSYIAKAVEQADKNAVLYAILAMFLVILLYDQLIFRPLVRWSEKFKFSAAVSEQKTPNSFLGIILARSRLIQRTGELIGLFWDGIINFHLRSTANKETHLLTTESKTYLNTTFLWFWYLGIAILAIATIIFLVHFIIISISPPEIFHVLLLGIFTSIRVLSLIALCSLIWVPIGVWVGLHPKATQIVQPVTQFLAAFPAYLVYPVVIMMIVKYHLNIELWTAPLMILGTQWYILFNVIAGTSTLPKDLYQATNNFGVKGWLWWKRFILPGIFPYYITGAITAAGGAWNASIVAEVVSWGTTTLQVPGLGAYIKQYTVSGDFPRIALGISIMCIYVLVINRLIWQPLYNLAQKRFQLK